MEGLPLLPGYGFRDQTKTKFHLGQNFNFRDGFRRPRSVCLGVGGAPLDADSVAYFSLPDHIRYDPSLTYGRAKSKRLARVVPHWEVFDKKVLLFHGYFQHPVLDSPDENYRVRHVQIFYFLEDDTITVIEPRVENSGITQGRLVRRGKILKDSSGSLWHWKDLNLGIDIPLHGFVFHTVDCDSYTREFMASQGIELNPVDDMPADPYTEKRRLCSYPDPDFMKTQTCDDNLRRFKDFDGQILRFWAAWDDRDNEFGEMRPFVINYHLTDDRVQIQEVRLKNDGRDPFPLLVKKIKLPKKWKNISDLSGEVDDENDAAYYSPMDFQVGSTISVLGRRFLIYDCDKFTRRYYQNQLHITQGPPMDVFPKKSPPVDKAIPPHNLFGTPEDSIQNCLSLHPVPPKKDFVRYCVNANKYLRYEAKLKFVHPEDEGRTFVFNYHLADGTLKIVEPPIRNSGFVGGTFLQATCVSKPGSDLDKPDLYTPGDFYIGSVIWVNGQQFIITDADLRVYTYMIENPEKFPRETIANLRGHMVKNGLLAEEIGGETDVLPEK